MQKRSQGSAFCVWNKEGKLAFRDEIQQNAAEERVEAYTGIVGAHCVPEARLRGCEPRRVPAQPERAPPHCERRAAFERARTMLRMRFFFTNERRTVSRCGPSTNMKKRPAGRLYICTSVILLFHPVRRKDSFLPDPVQRGWALLRNRDFLLLPPEWVPLAVLFELSGSSEPSTHFQSNR